MTTDTIQRSIARNLVLPAAHHDGHGAFARRTVETQPQRLAVFLVEGFLVDEIVRWLVQFYPEMPVVKT